MTNRLAGAQKLQDLVVNQLINCRSFLVRNRYDDIMINKEGKPIRFDGLTAGDTISLFFSFIADAGLKVKSWSISGWRYKNANRLGEQRWTTNLPLDLCRQPQYKIAWAVIHELILEFQITPDLMRTQSESSVSKL